MTTYYVRKTGSDSNAGTSAGAAWLTIGKALGASGISSGDTVYIGAGTYRELVTVAMTSAVAETKVIGDVTGAYTGDAGPVIWSGYTTDDKTSPSTSAACLTINAKDYLTFEDIVFSGAAPGSGTSCVWVQTAAENGTFRRCVFISGRTSLGLVNITGTAGVAANWTIDRCAFIPSVASIPLSITLPRHSADWDANITVKNCVFYGQSGNQNINVASSGAGAGKGGGVDIFNCTFWASQVAVDANDANLSTTYPVNVYNSLIVGQSTACLRANTTGQIVEDYNYLVGLTTRTNVTAGGNSIAVAAASGLTYALLLEAGQSWLHGFRPRPALSPMVESPLLGFGNQAGGPTDDFVGATRPAGPARTWAVATNSIGAFERPDTATKETTTVRTGSNAAKLLGPSSQDFEVAVDAETTTVTVYGRYDSAYGAGTKPRLIALANAAIGVTEQTDTVAGAADTWEQLSVSFTPTAAGIVTLRLRSDGDGDGAAFFDDFLVA